LKLLREFYYKDTLTVAKELLGKVLIHNINGNLCSGIIVETEAYLGKADKAAHSYKSKTPRVEVMYGPPGFAYVYFIYGLYFCTNVVTREEGTPEAVLIRALEPLAGIDLMVERRYKNPSSSLTEKQIINLTNGPSKLSQALSIDRNNNGNDLCGDKLYIEDYDYPRFTIKSAKRIGIDYAEEAKDFLWRFYIEGNKFVSKK
jgi:DNA-3-methyladenine glycosylase